MLPVAFERTHIDQGLADLLLQDEPDTLAAFKYARKYTISSSYV
jgi:hypothetical protein